MADVDAVNERLNGLVTLLQAVGVGGVDKNEMDRVSQSLSKGDLGLPDARQLNDEQVEALIRKLQQAQAEAPQIIAALEAHAEARSLNGGQGRAAAQQQMQQQQQQHEEEDDDDDDEYDEDGNYPMVGHGCSDDISVVSDLTTPTVLTGVPVPEEEHYRETLPPMMVGGGHGEAPPMMIQPPRRKNLVNQVARGGPGVVPPPRRIAPQTAQPSRSTAGGAAAARRKNYQSTMAKLHENPHGMGYVGPAGAPAQQHSPPPKKGHGSSSSIGSSEKPRQGSVSGEGRTPKGGPKSRTGAPSAGGPKKRVVKKAPPPEKDPSNFSELASSRAAAPKNNSAGWNAFDAPAPRSPKKPQTSIDDDGFLVGDGFDPFGAAPIDTAAANPFRSPAGDLAFNALTDPFMASAGFDAAFPADGKKKTRPKKPERMPSAQSTRSKGVGAGSTAGGVHHPGAPAQRPRPRSGRRASTSN